MKKFFTSKYKIAFDVVVSLAIVAALLHYAGFDEFLEELVQIDLWWLFVSIFLMFGMYLGMVLRMKLLLDEMGAPLPWISIFKAHLTGMLLADITPARTGYLAAAAVMHKNYKISSEKAMVAILGPQAYDFIFKVLLGGIAILYIINYAGIENGWVLGIGIAGLSVVILTMLLLLYSRKFLNLFRFSENWPFVGKIYSLFHRVQDHSKVVIRKTPTLLGIMLITWLFKAFSWYAVAKAVGMEVVFEYPESVFYLFFQPLITMLEFVPTPTLAGMGFSEAGGVLALSFFGITAAKATAFMLVIRFNTVALHLPGIEEALKLIK